MVHERVKIVFFDAGETLVHPLPSFPELFTEICAEHGLEFELERLPSATRNLMAGIENRQREGYTFTDDQEVSRRFWLEFYSELTRALGHTGEDGMLPEALYRAFSEPGNYGAYHDVLETLGELAEAGVKLGLISNFESWLEGLLENLDLDRYLEIRVISGKEGFEKPHPRIFELALERAGVEPHQAMHVGDSPISDFEGAERAGLQAVLLDRWERFPEFRGKRIRGLREIPDLLI